MIDNMPCVPQIIQRLVDALQRNAGASELTQIVQQDPVLAARIYVAAGGGSLEQGLHTLINDFSSDQLHALIFRQGLRQALDGSAVERYSSQHIALWKAALRGAIFARELAACCAYPFTDEAYLAGLFFNVGQLALLGKDQESYAQMLLAEVTAEHLQTIEQQLFDSEHCAVGADFLQGCGFPGFLVDAVRFQRELLPAIEDAHPLVKIAHVAGLFANSTMYSDTVIPALQGLFAVDASNAQTLIARSIAEFKKLDSQLGLTNIQLGEEAHRQLGMRLAEWGELSQIRLGVLQSGSFSAACDMIQQWLSIRFGIGRVILFKHEISNAELMSDPESFTGLAGVRIALEPRRSLVSDSWLQGEPISGGDSKPATVVDRQLLGFLQGDILQCWPLSVSSNKIGVLVYAIAGDSYAELDHNKPLLADIVTLTAHCAQSAEATDYSTDANEHDTLTAGFRRQISEAVHEAGNPLSIIRNYIEMVRLKLGEDQDVGDSLDLIGSEITRVADILDELRDGPLVAPNNEEIADVNQLIKDVVKIISDSIGVAKNLTFDLQLGKQIEYVPGRASSLKQVMMNLLKNAVEAQREGGEVRVRSDGNANFNGQQGISLSVSDNGPGLPEEVLASLFTGGVTTKGSDHAGLGLGIVMKLVEGMDGQILCHSNELGTEFEIFLPIVGSAS